jgi:ssDNA-binding replication factor A large subunit
VEAKRAKLSGLISREGAAQIVAAELGINFEKEKVKVNEIMEGMKKVNTLGKMIQLFPVREFKKENREGKVVNFIIADETGNIRVVLWDTNHIGLIERQELKEGEFIEINNANLRNNELHLTGFSDIKKSNMVIENVKEERDFVEMKIAEFNIRGNFRARAFIVQAFEPRFFEVCPECGSRVTNDVDASRCAKHGKVIPKRRVQLSIVLDDGSASIRAILFSEQIEKLGLKEGELEPGIFVEKRRGLLGREAFFSGNVRQNKLFNNLEFFVSDINEIEIDKLIEVLEK